MAYSHPEADKDQHEFSETDVDDSATDIESGSPVKNTPDQSTFKDKEMLAMEDARDSEELNSCNRVETLKKVILVLQEKEIVRELAMAKYVQSTIIGPPDVCFMVENIPLYSFKNILSFSSPKFKTMFEGRSTLRYQFLDLDEPSATTGSQVSNDIIRIDKLTIPNASKSVFREFLTLFIFKHNITTELTMKLDVLILAYDYEVQDMIAALEGQIIDLMTAKYLPKCLEVVHKTKSERLNDFLTRFVPNVDQDNVIELLTACHKYDAHKSLQRRIMKRLKKLPPVTGIPGWNELHSDLKNKIIIFLQTSKVPH